jgi:hypothetical protein
MSVLGMGTSYIPVDRKKLLKMPTNCTERINHLKPKLV